MNSVPSLAKSSEPSTGTGWEKSPEARRRAASRNRATCSWSARETMKAKSSASTRKPTSRPMARPRAEPIESAGGHVDPDPEPGGAEVRGGEGRRAARLVVGAAAGQRLAVAGDDDAGARRGEQGGEAGRRLARGGHVGGPAAAEADAVQRRGDRVARADVGQRPAAPCHPHAHEALGGAQPADLPRRRRGVAAEDRVLKRRVVGDPPGRARRPAARPPVLRGQRARVDVGLGLGARGDEVPDQPEGEHAEADHRHEDDADEQPCQPSTKAHVCMIGRPTRSLHCRTVRRECLFRAAATGL